jgi:hypothetical protein
MVVQALREALLCALRIENGADSAGDSKVLGLRGSPPLC